MATVPRRGDGAVRDNYRDRGGSVKRHKGSIGRPVLDQLRGALPYHKALWGTLIARVHFSKGCAEAALCPGAAPVGLINGEKLLELLVEHGIGIEKRPATLCELDESYSEVSFEDELVEDALDTGPTHPATPESDGVIV